MAAKQNWTDFRMANDPEFRSKMIALVERAAARMQQRFTERVANACLNPDGALYATPQQWFGNLSSISDTPSIEEIQEDLRRIRMRSLWEGMFEPQPIPPMAMSS